MWLHDINNFTHVLENCFSSCKYHNCWQGSSGLNIHNLINIWGLVSNLWGREICQSLKAQWCCKLILSFWPLHTFACVWFLWIDSQWPHLMTRLSLNKQQITLTAKLRTTSFQWTHVNVCLYQISMIFCRLECGLCQNSVEIENNSSALSCLHILQRCSDTV